MILTEKIPTGRKRGTNGRMVMRYSLLKEDEAEWYTKFRRKIKDY